MLVRGFPTIFFLLAFAAVAFSPLTVKADAIVTVRVYDFSTDPVTVIDHSEVRGPISISDSVFLAPASASAAADLQSGTLRINSSAAGLGLAGSLAVFNDQLTFSSGPGGPNTFNVTIGMNVHGSIFSPESNTTVEAGLFVPAASPQFVNVVYTGTGTYSDTLFQTFSVQAGNQYFFMAQLNNTVNTFRGTVDFSNTASVFLILPSGVTYTSESGAFLTQPPGAIPEPATMLLLGTGLVGVAAKVRRCRRTRRER